MTVEAYEPAEPNDLVRIWARVVLATLIAVGVAGWIWGDGTSGFKMGMCLVTAVIEIWGFNAAVQWSRASKRRRVGGPYLYWSVMICSCAGWTIFSLYHALDLIAGEMGAAAAPAYVAFTALAIALPFHEWAIERVETAPIRTRPAHSEPVSPPIDERPPGRKIRPRATKRAVSGGRPMLTLIQNGALAALIAQMPFTPRDMSKFERAVLIAHENPGLTQDEIAKRADVPRATVGRWLSMAPEVFRRAA